MGETLSVPLVVEVRHSEGVPECVGEALGQCDTLPQALGLKLSVAV